MSQNKIYVGNLSYSATSEDLRAFFERFGTVVEVKVIMDRESGRSKGFAFVTFETDESAQASLASDGTEMKERKIRVNIAKEVDRSAGGGRGGAGGRGGRSGGAGGRGGAGGFRQSQGEGRW